MEVIIRWFTALRKHVVQMFYQTVKSLPPPLMKIFFLKFTEALTKGSFAPSAGLL
jgi:hypothetical protein